MQENTYQTPSGKLIEIDGIQYQIIDGKLYRYADLTFDKGFKIVLGRIGSEEVLRHLLNRMLGTSIIRLEYRNTEHPGMTEDENSSRFDVYCEDESGCCFQIEMQNWSQKHFYKRAIYYSSLVVIDQATKAQAEFKKAIGKDTTKRWDYNFQPLYVVSFLNFKNWTSENILEKSYPYISTYRYADVETKEELGNCTNLVFVDLHSFKKKEEECESLEDIWMYSIKNMHKLNSCPEKAKGTEIEDLYTKSELAKMTHEQRLTYEKEVMTRNDFLNFYAEGKAEALAEGRAEGLAEGRAEGLAEGRAEGLAEGKAEGRAEGQKEKAIEIAGKLIATGMSAREAANFVGIAEEDL